MPVAKYKKEKHGDGYLYYTYEKTGTFTSKGTPEYKKLRAKTIAKLDEKVKEFRSNTAFGVEQTNITVDDWEKQWFEAYKSGCRENTKKFYENLYNKHIQPVIGSARLNQVREHTCQKILTDMSEEYSVKTVSSVRSILFSLFDKAQANKFIVINPAAKLVAKGRPKGERRALTEKERNAYLKACTEHPFGDFAAVLYFFGLRRGEALALTKEDVCLDHITVSKQYIFPENNTPKLSYPKTDAGTREVFIPTKARQYIDFSDYEEGLLFCEDDGSPFSFSQIVDRWKSFIHYALGKDTDITMHCLRHNYCTMLFEQGVDVFTAKELMGHDDINTTLSVYTHYTQSIQKRNKAKALKIG